MKKILALLAIVVLIIGGCSMKKETLTKEQQDNVVKRIVRGYNIKSIEFISFSRDNKTGMYHLVYVINNNEQYKTGLSLKEISRFNNSEDGIGMSPTNIFDSFKRKEPLEELDEELKKINIIYLKE
ncbi:MULTISPECIES: hypothetical protein [unclassified Granulicatella]|uniref:hypothetical protein n=1 Tax=unclassified Granulicatella TaxID=2630493 RepID=UPI001D168AD1|nr:MULTISPECIES: hypothetical protein [unclassified Granulicatella]